MSPEEAIEIIAQHVTAALCEQVWDERESYPELGEHDWVAVCLHVDDSDYPGMDEYDTAYQVLTDRARVRRENPRGPVDRTMT